MFNTSNEFKIMNGRVSVMHNNIYEVFLHNQIDKLIFCVERASTGTQSTTGDKKCLTQQ